MSCESYAPIQRACSTGMPCNFDRRVELIVPVDNQGIKRYLIDEVLNIYLRDNVKARRLLSNGRCERIQARPGEAQINSQEYFIAPEEVRGMPG